jgi:hypothetical protein
MIQIFFCPERKIILSFLSEGEKTLFPSILISALLLRLFYIIFNTASKFGIRKFGSSNRENAQEYLRHAYISQPVAEIPRDLIRIYLNVIVNKDKVFFSLNRLSTTPWRHIGEWRYISNILKLSTGWEWVVSFTPLLLYPPTPPPTAEVDAGIHWIGCLVGQKFSLDAVEKRNISYSRWE